VAAVQVTPLKEPGRKAWDKPCRLTLGVLPGAAVRLAPWAPGQRLVLVEGVEDGLAVAAACPDVAVWAVLGAWNTGAVALPRGVDVTLCLDGDATGRAAALQAAQALWARGHRCRLAELPAGQDPNALLAGTEA
jgi:DNA primase